MLEGVYIIMRKTKGFSYDDEKDLDVINYLDAKHDFSGYIKQLIRDDMNKNDIRTIIDERIEEYMTTHSLSGLSCLSEKVEDRDENIIEKDILDDIMNM